MSNLQKKIVKVRSAGRNWHTTEAFTPLLLKEVLPQLDKTDFIHIRRHRRTAIIDTSEGKCFIKMYLVRKSRLRQAIEFMLRRTRASEEWVNHLEIWEAGVVSPEPLAFSEKLPLSLNYTSLFVMRAMDPGLISLRQWIEAPPGNKLPLTREAHRKAVGFLAGMHDRGMYHMDFTDVNIWGRIVDDRWLPEMVIDFEKYRSGDPEDFTLAFTSLERASKKLKMLSNVGALRLLWLYMKDRGILDNSEKRARYTRWIKESGAATGPESYAARSAARKDGH